MTHPITPPPELALQWINEYLNEHPEGLNVEVLVVSAAQWGADQELEACCEWMAEETPISYINALRAARRSKPPSLKEQAVEALHGIIDEPNTFSRHIETVRRALEQLDD